MHIDPNITQCVTNFGDTIREMIRHEDELTNQRLTWLGQFQGMLFVAYSFLAAKYERHRAILAIICVVGVVVALSIGVATYAAGQATNNLLADWRAQKVVQGNDCWQQQAPMQGISNAFGAFGTIMWPAHMVPPLFVLAWLVLLIIHPLTPKRPSC